jgi:hypothetical protein
LFCGKTRHNPPPSTQRPLSFILFRSMTNDLNRKTECKCEGNDLPERMLFKKRNQQHYKAKNAHHNCECVLL